MTNISVREQAFRRKNRGISTVFYTSPPATAHYRFTTGGDSCRIARSEQISSSTIAKVLEITDGQGVDAMTDSVRLSEHHVKGKIVAKLKETTPIKKSPLHQELGSFMSSRVTLAPINKQTDRPSYSLRLSAIPDLLCSSNTLSHA